MNFRASGLTVQQLAAIQKEFDLSQTELLTVAVDRLARSLLGDVSNHEAEDAVQHFTHVISRLESGDWREWSGLDLEHLEVLLAFVQRDPILLD